MSGTITFCGLTSRWIDAALVGVGERVGERQADPQDVAVRELVRRLELGERAALDQLGDEVAAAVLLAGVEQRDDRVVVEPRDGAGLALGPLRRRRRRPG